MSDYEFKEEVMREADKKVVEQVLMYIKHLAIRYNLPYKELSNKLQDNFIYNYVELSKYQKDDIKLALKQNNCNYHALLNECIYEALDVNPIINIEEVPFVNKVTKSDIITLETTIGTVKVGKASEYFKDAKTSYIFNKKLVNECFDRTLEFVRENEEYDAVVSYVPNIFVGGHYHAYAKKDDIIIDASSNAIYFDNTGELTQKGDVIFTDKYSNIGGEIGEETPHLLKIALK